MQIDTNGFELDDEARDTITGYQGRVVGFTQWTTGCARAVLQAPIVDKKEQKAPEPMSVDVTVLDMVKKGPRHETPVAASSHGGPRPTPARRADPAR